MAAREGDERYRRYFHIFPDRSTPDAYERTLPEVFPDFAPGNFTWDDDVAGWVWTTFNEWQWDVDWSNPDVVCEYADVILFFANLGVEVLRLDAIAFIWKRLGTTSQNEPEVHAITQTLRALAHLACPAVEFKAEAIVSPSDVVHYLGRGARWGKVSDLAYHNSLMVHIWSMLASRDVRLSVHALRAIGEVPSTTAWITYARCHDDIGWAIDDADAAAVYLSGPAHRAFLSDYYSGDFWQSPARGLVFQHNEVTGDRRISGMLASLAGLDAALDEQTATGSPTAVDTAVDRILLIHAIVLGWGGVPILWMGDEIGLRNDRAWAEEPAHADDNRWVHRPRMPWDVAERRHEEGTVEQRIFAGVVHLARVRAGLVQLHAAVAAEPLEPTDPGVLVVLRRHPVGPMLGLYNVTDTERPFPGWRLAAVGLEPALTIDALSARSIDIDPNGDLRLPPYAARWLDLIQGSSIRVFEAIGVLSLDFLDLQHSDGGKHSDGSAVEERDEAFRGDLPVGVCADLGHLLPVRVDVQADAEPAAAAHVRRAEEALGLLLDELLLDTRRRGAPDGQAAVAVVVVQEHDERLLVAHEERRRPMTEALGRLRQGEADAPNLLERSVGGGFVVHGGSVASSPAGVES